MGNTQTALNEIFAAGLCVELNQQGKIFVKPQGLITPELRSLIQRNREGIVAHFSSKVGYGGYEGLFPQKAKKCQSDVLCEKTDVSQSAEQSLLTLLGSTQKNTPETTITTTDPTKRLFRPRGTWLSPAEKVAADAYHAHHFACKTCQAAGRGHTTRCSAGAGLWAQYQGAAA